jgi:hypothetical protein
VLLFWESWYFIAFLAFSFSFIYCPDSMPFWTRRVFSPGTTYYMNVVPCGLSLLFSCVFPHFIVLGGSINCTSLTALILVSGWYYNTF